MEVTKQVFPKEVNGITEEEKITKFLELKSLISKLEKEIKPLEKEIKEKYTDKNLVIGHFHVTGKWVDRAGYEVKPVTYWQLTILPIGE